MLAITTIFALAGLVWGTILLLRGNLLWGCLGLLVVTSTFGVYFLQFDVGGVTLSFDRLAIVGLIGCFFVQWKLGKVEIRPWMTIDTIIVVFFGVLILNAFSHDWKTTEPGQVPIIQHLINGYLIPLTIYFVARNLPYQDADIDRLLLGLSLFGLYLAITGICEGLGLYSIVFPRYIADPEIGLHFGRARGPMVQSVSYGVYLCVCMIATWLLAMRS